MPQEDNSAGKLHHPQKIFWVVFPANDHATKIMKPREQAFDFPAATIAPQRTTVLGDRFAAIPSMWSDQRHSEFLADLSVQRVAIVGFISNQSLRCLAQESSLESGLDEGRFIWRSADHVHGDRKTMAVADRHDFAAFAAASRPDSRAPFFAELKLASMNVSLKSSFPRSRKSSASFCSSRVSSPEHCHCWKRR